ncbi:hypothetical protein K504DRAFT_501017 [Pleomassaria siparia CBS 279.74]|uniref:Uncharacterized protein n=1 Tax=Pleomassaria siparia CBS 279.74 TaxID=1314801 RepID=A0A6G1KEW2_9PLEO|nr:hypothetical protein K504DRAFT_501017 [Pleomassaria siparia CBS 279.74]
MDRLRNLFPRFFANDDPQPTLQVAQQTTIAPPLNTTSIKSHAPGLILAPQSPQKPQHEAGTPTSTFYTAHSLSPSQSDSSMTSAADLGSKDISIRKVEPDPPQTYSTLVEIQEGYGLCEPLTHPKHSPSLERQSTWLTKASTTHCHPRYMIHRHPHFNYNPHTPLAEGSSSSSSSPEQGDIWSHPTTLHPALQSRATHISHHPQIVPDITPRLRESIEKTLMHRDPLTKEPLPIILPWDRRSTSSHSLYCFPTSGGNRSNSSSRSSSPSPATPHPTQSAPSPSPTVDVPATNSAADAKDPTPSGPGIPVRSPSAVSLTFSDYSDVCRGSCPLCSHHSPDRRERESPPKVRKGLWRLFRIKFSEQRRERARIVSDKRKEREEMQIERRRDKEEKKAIRKARKTRAGS